MILGLGTDIAETARIEEAVQHHGDDFLKHFLTDPEFNEFQNRGRKMDYAAGRWAAKEAVSKLLGCGIGHGCNWLDLEILNTQTGAPELSISGRAADTAEKMGIRKIWISISHERHYAIATAIAEN